MRQSTQIPQNGIGTESSPGTGTLGSGVAFVALALAVLWALSNPTLAASVTAAVVGAVTLALAGGRALARRLRGRIAKLSIPGVATVRISVSPN
ncbi:hypothetical protein [Natronobacterium gregoryi]|uniref:Uncharacterized protein n=2 Tax=Natronobacterium gregoryi TaxID=44930 RepID=L0AGJ9_NATGS|nr:hypothetical protein [Natronobacterium gregoryi]AFZ72951.1 hypothetical protein Natgr_1756 [Natronobacterium gregoryi SP2]ELY69901.1 hypothetical protein C490_07119 [Natronobacterium gregoryi SP2]PLK21825.1 hypothetical protein CYV19_01620 [Natronobacterium gregoryi SP2]SFI68349.1 hypothetical protein SAMN05443661_103122 [Natronobacterium gregoryi]